MRRAPTTPPWRRDRSRSRTPLARIPEPVARVRVVAGERRGGRVWLRRRKRTVLTLREHLLSLSTRITQHESFDPAVRSHGQAPRRVHQIRRLIDQGRRNILPHRRAPVLPPLSDTESSDESVIAEPVYITDSEASEEAAPLPEVSDHELRGVWRACSLPFLDMRFYFKT